MTVNERCRSTVHLGDTCYEPCQRPAGRHRIHRFRDGGLVIEWTDEEGVYA